MRKREKNEKKNSEMNTNIRRRTHAFFNAIDCAYKEIPKIS